MARSRLARLRSLDKRTRRAAATVKVLAALSWPERVVSGFLDDWQKNKRRLPVVKVTTKKLTPAKTELEAVIAEASGDDPNERYVRDTAQSYLLAAQMLECRGSALFTELSRAIYGHPRDTLPGGALTHLEAAQRLLDNTSALAAAGVVHEEDVCITAEAVRDIMAADFAKFFGASAPAITIDPKLASKAAAGAKKVRVRGMTCFSSLDIAQLREHEGYVHAATALNGWEQPNLSLMRMSSPRTTKTQEGLATVAELITRAIDIGRLRRIALRTIAIDMALEGADFLQVFEYFVESGQSPDESVRSAMRVFRSGHVAGGIAFTKDVVYLAGLIEVHTFLRKAIETGRPHLIGRLFAGRVTLGDVIQLGDSFDAGDLAGPRFVPEWATDLPRLTAYLAFNALVDLVDLRQLDLERLG
ncbi:MAG: tyrosine/phenylalanine carboxypeptidase domain-containing protein [Sandaracinaceae bacterium]